jgi:acyl homoserine lactone synthase
MITIVEQSNLDQFPQLVEDMYRTRARVFSERLGWDVNVVNDLEIDQFDDADPLYLISTDDDMKQFYGSVRLLRTTGPNMLRDVFNCLLDDDEVIESPLIWESSRFSINPDVMHEGENFNKKLVNQITFELLLGLTEVGMKVGIDFIVSVYDARMARIFRSAKCTSTIIGTPQKIGKVKAYAGLFETNQSMIDQLAKAGSIYQSVLSPNTRIAA